MYESNTKDSTTTSTNTSPTTSANTSAYYSTETSYLGREKRKFEDETGELDKSEVKRRMDEEVSVVTSAYEPMAPEWEKNDESWAYLQSMSPYYPSAYLLNKHMDDEGRAGYLLGRSPECDLVLDKKEISKRHCLIYKETGATAKLKGLRIFLKDLSFNGTYVNNKRIGINERVLLKMGDLIHFYSMRNEANTSISNPSFKILLPYVYETNSCEAEYQLYGRLGKGNFAVVYRGVHKKSGRVVAVKVIDKTRFLHRPAAIKAISQEVSILMGLEKHPSVVKVEKFFNEEKRMFLILEYVQGGELFNLILERKSISEIDTRFIFWQLFSATKYLHDRNIVHRDLKPENVLIANKDLLHVKITDFGLAVNIKRDKSLNTQCGTFNYVAPEILTPSDSRAYDSQCDLWSLGVILYVCLSGYPPFSESEGCSLKKQIIEGIYDFDTQIWTHISEQAKDLIRKLLNTDPDERLTTVEALEHPWMSMDADKLETMMNTLGPENLQKINYFSMVDGLSLTQANYSYSQPS